MVQTSLRFGNHPIHQIELEREFGSAELVALYEESALAKEANRGQSPAQARNMTTKQGFKSTSAPKMVNGLLRGLLMYTKMYIRFLPIQR